MNKHSISDLAMFGGAPLFDEIKSTSNLVQPDQEKFFDYIKQSFDDRWITNNGPCVRQLEKRLEELHEVEHCIALCSGFWALVLTIKSLALEGKREVVMPSLTYRRLADIAAWLDLIPRFCEVNPETLGVSRQTAEQCITDETAIILAPHPIVNLCDIEGLVELSESRGIPLIFDSVEAAYATHGGKHVGNFGNAECFSVHASKFLNGFEGGYVVTNDVDLADRLRIMRGFGFRGEDNVESLGMNAKLNDVHAAMFLASIDDISDQLVRNRKLYERYEIGLAETSLELVTYRQDELRTHKSILVRLGEGWPLSRDKTLDILHSEKMLARPYYYPPLHEKKTSYQTIVGDLTHSSELARQFVLMPSGDFLDEQDVSDICEFMRFLEENGAEIEARGNQ